MPAPFPGERGISLRLILRKYVIREIALPTLMALLTITFMLMIRYLFDWMDLVLQPGIGLWNVTTMMLSLLPSVAVFAAPMAILIGVLIGVGRMTMDREVLAMRASGINLLAVFSPVIALALLLSGVIYWLSSGWVPHQMRQAMMQVNQMTLSLIGALEPGRFYEDLPVELDAVFFFKERDPETGAMRGIVLEVEKDVNNIPPPSRILHEAASAAPWAEEAATTDSTILKELGLPARQTELLLIVAESGEIVAREISRNDQSQAAEITLRLTSGTIHQRSTDPEDDRYVVIQFDELERTLFNETKISDVEHTMSNAELLARAAERLAANGGAPDRRAGDMMEELWQRRSICWARLRSCSWDSACHLGCGRRENPGHSDRDRADARVLHIMQMGLSWCSSSGRAGVLAPCCRI